MTNLSKVTDVFSDILAKSKWGQQPVPGNFIPRPKGGGKGRKVSGSFEPDASVPDKSSYIIGMEKAEGTSGRSYRYRDEGTRGVARKVSTQAFGSDATTSPRRSRKSIDFKRGSDKYKNIDRATIRKPDDATFVEGLEKARILKAFGVMKATGGRHNLHPVEPRSKTAAELTRKSDGGEKANSGARGATPAILGMLKARRKRVSEMTGAEIIDANKQGKLSINRSYRPGQGPHPEYAKESPDPHGDNLSEPYVDTRSGSKRHGEIPKEGWKEAALLYPAHRKEQQGGRKVKSRVGDSIGGYPT